MIKSTLIYSVLALFFFFGQAFAGNGPAFPGVTSAARPNSLIVFSSLNFYWCPAINCQGFTAQSPGTLDTIPVTERFDEPLSGALKPADERQSAFPTEAGDRKVIPVTTIETDTSYRSLLEIPEGYTGFEIEIISTSVPLPPEHDIFFQHGKITMEQLGESDFSYLIGHFRAEKKAEAFRASFLAHRYPESRVVGYTEGQRVSAPAQKK